MKVNYKLADGTTALVEVSAEVAAALEELDRLESNEQRKYRDRNEASIDAFNAETGWEPADPNADVEAEIERNEERERIDGIISQLSDKQQKVCRLYFFEGYTLERIGKLLGVSKPAVLYQIETIKKKLKKLF